MKLLRKLYIKTTNFTHGYQNESASKLIAFYRLWAPLYDISVKIDPAYYRNLKKMIDVVVSPSDITLDVGCGTGLGTLYTAKKAQKVTGIDSSMNMLNKLKKKIKKNIANINLVEGLFPQAIKNDEKFGSIISSFMLVHCNPVQRTHTIKAMHEILEPGGKIGLFSAQGEIAPAFAVKEEIENNLKNAGFHNIQIQDVDDIFRISTAFK